MVFIQFNDLQVYGISNRNLCPDDQESKSIYYKGQGKSHKITVSDAIQSSQKIIRHLYPLDFCVVSPPLLPFFLSFFFVSSSLFVIVHHKVTQLSSAFFQSQPDCFIFADCFDLEHVYSCMLTPKSKKFPSVWSMEI